MKKLMCMQPYFLPYLGYFSLIKHTDLFVVSNTLQYINKGFINRNRILKPKPHDDTCYIGIPLVKFPHTASINEVIIDSKKDFRAKIYGQLATYKKAAFYRQTLEVLDEILSSNATKLDEFILHSIKVLCKYLNIELRTKLLSSIDINKDNILDSDDWALETAKILGFREYYNPYNGISFYNVKKFNDNGIKIYFQRFNTALYKQDRDIFIPSLSIVDAMMFNSIEAIHGFLDDFSWIDKNTTMGGGSRYLVKLSSLYHLASRQDARRAA